MVENPDNTPGPAYLKPYADAVEQYGGEFRATLWNSREGQALRFDVLADMADFEGCHLVDVGCGQGDFAAHLIERGIAFASFTGLDAMTAMIDTARARNLPRCEFQSADVVANPGALAIPGADWYRFSGTLNTMDDDTARGLLRACFDHAAQGIAFNFLSNRPHAKWQGRDLTPARRFDTLRWLDWAMGLTSRVQFRQDYFDGHDATICLRHDADADG